MKKAFLSLALATFASSGIFAEPQAISKSFNFNTRTVTLNSGYEMPIVGLGTWTLDNDTTARTVYLAIKEGFRLFDTAQYYGNEIGVGRGINRAINEGIIKREDVFVTTKVMPSAYRNPTAEIERSYERLNLDYIDLLLIHQPGSNDQAVYKAMEAEVKKGKVHSIGISNYYTEAAVKKLLSYATIKPAVIQNENHIYFQNTKLQEYCDKEGIVLESWYPFGGRGHTNENLNNPVIPEIAKAHKKSGAQVIIRWQIQAGYIVIPGTSNPAHLKENINVFDFTLTQDEMKKIAAINKNRRYENW